MFNLNNTDAAQICETFSQFSFTTWSLDSDDDDEYNRLEIKIVFIFFFYLNEELKLSSFLDDFLSVFI